MNATQANAVAEAYRAAHPCDVDINCILNHITAAAANGHFQIEEKHLREGEILALNALGFAVQYVHFWSFFRSRFIISWR